MTHRLGIITDDMLATELYIVAHAKGYETASFGNVVTVVNHSGLKLNVEVIAGKYIVKCTDRNIAYASVNTAIKGIKKAFDKLTQTMNGQYD